MKFRVKINYWRILEPVLLGVVANILINYIFNPSDPDSNLDEFVVAILFSALITELNRFINGKLENKYSWTTAPDKRFMYNLFYLALSLFFILNVIGNIYMWLAHDSFYDWNEMLTINLITFLIALLLTIFKWTAHFYKRWRHTEQNLDVSNRKFNELSSKIDETDLLIDLQIGQKHLKTKSSDIKMGKSEFGITKVYKADDEFYIFQGTLSKLDSLLPDNMFFRATRDVILHRDTIVSISSASYGKVLLETNIINIGDLTVSRPKASAFRKWYNSNSV